METLPGLVWHMSSEQLEKNSRNDWNTLAKSWKNIKLALFLFVEIEMMGIGCGIPKYFLHLTNGYTGSDNFKEELASI